jgi:transcriptional regulator with XRE-family HTH domain
MSRHGVTTRELAAALGISVRTIHNISCKNSQSHSTRQKISDYLAANIWPDIQAQSSRGLIAQDTVFLRLSREEADNLHAQFPDTTQVQAIFGAHGPFVVEFLKDTPAILSLKNPNSAPIPIPRPKKAARP